MGGVELSSSGRHAVLKYSGSEWDCLKDTLTRYPGTKKFSRASLHQTPTFPISLALASHTRLSAVAFDRIIPTLFKHETSSNNHISCYNLDGLSRPSWALLDSSERLLSIVRIQHQQRVSFRVKAAAAVIDSWTADDPTQRHRSSIALVGPCASATFDGAKVCGHSKLSVGGTTRRIARGC